MDGKVRRYMDTLDKLLHDYAFAGIQAVATVPDFLVQTCKLPDPAYNIIFRQSGELHSYYGTYAQHTVWLVSMQRGQK